MERKPLLLVIRGIFAPTDQMSAAVEAFPEADVAFPSLPVPNIEEAVSAYDALLDKLRRPTVVCGVSMGGIVALGLRSPHLRGVLSLDPPLRTSAMTPLVGPWRAMKLSEAERETVWRVFGISGSAHVDRDYTGLLRGLQAPTVCLIGEQTGPVPSLVSPEARTALEACRGVRLSVVPGVGHDIGAGGSKAIYDALRWLLACAMAEQT